MRFGYLLQEKIERSNLAVLSKSCLFTSGGPLPHPERSVNVRWPNRTVKVKVILGDLMHPSTQKRRRDPNFLQLEYVETSRIHHTGDPFLCTICAQRNRKAPHVRCCVLLELCTDHRPRLRPRPRSLGPRAATRGVDLRVRSGWLGAGLLVLGLSMHLQEGVVLISVFAGVHASASYVSLRRTRRKQLDPHTAPF